MSPSVRRAEQNTKGINSMAEKTKLLKDCRVLDFSNEMGFLCGKIFGDLGADVIKVEPPGVTRPEIWGRFTRIFRTLKRISTVFVQSQQTGNHSRY